MSARLPALVLAGCLALGPAVGSLVAADFSPAAFGRFTPDTPPLEAAAALQLAIDACAAAGGGRVVIEPGPAVTIASVRLRSHTELHLSRGAVLRGSPRHADFTAQAPWPIQLPADRPVQTSGVIIAAEDADDVALTGPGVIDGNSPAYVTKRGTEIHECPNERPFAVVFTRCNRVTVRDIVLKDSPFWTLRMLGCDDVLIDAVRILGDPLMPNNDGIDIDWSSNVRITDCHVDTGDDCISLKTSPAYRGARHPCENVVVTNCTLRTRSAAIAVGCDVEGPIRDAVFSDLTIKDSHRGLALRLSCNGSIERLLFSNITIETRLYDDRWWGRGEPIHILAMPWTKEYHNGIIRDIRFSHIICRGENGVVIVADQPGHVSGIHFDQVSLEVNKTTAWDGRRQDFRPNEVAAMPEIPVSGYLLRQVSDVIWKDCTVSWGSNRPDYYHHQLDAEGSANLQAAGLSGPSAEPGRWPDRRLVNSSLTDAPQP